MKKILKVTFRILLGIIAFIAIYLIAVFGLSAISTSAETTTDNKDITIYILTNGVHTDVVVPLKNADMDWSHEIKFENVIKSDTTAKLVAFGWGDKGFYLNTPTWSQLKFSVAFKAATGLSTSAIHATFYKNLREDASCKKINITKAQYHRLIAYIRNSFQADSAGHFINIKTNANYGDTDAFYEAKRRYNLFYTCNTWANNALKACGQKACLWTPMDKPIFKKY
ncbi:TIGR02117 family protein [Mucilaginibacter conchicola]|uniref:TIGR02117 family protein n=1 Tax=Mucilaginibacter conchicola TaxID=2303333 RepID=A0A372NXA0_9SPHI|nr:TIGR02117 family protein [Mucilaginibacter conchicola]RFZ94524.1 TIGR02117 family protein [Mucilaginibacter conchicola]